MRKLHAILPVLFVAVTLSARSTKELHIVTTGDLHGAYFDASYVGGKPRPSLMSVKCYVDSLREVAGEENVVLVDAGDCLQGDNATYYYNYVATDQPHIFPRMASYMGYDVCVLGNHDIETGHGCYDRVRAELSAYGIPWLSGNARTPSGGTYFPEYVILKKAGLKVLVLGYDNANIAAWLSPELWSGMVFQSLVPYVQERVNILNAKFKPDVTVVVVHSGIGEGDGLQLENQGLDIFKDMEGVDLLVCAHDHKPYVNGKTGCFLLNAGSHAGYVGHAVISFRKRLGRLSKTGLDAETVRIDKSKVDEEMRETFSKEFEAVRSFTLRKVGKLEMPLATRDAYKGMSDYVNLIHTVQMSVPEAEISLAAPLTFNGHVAAGEVVFNDMFTIYPYENQLFVLRLKGSEIVSALEFSYDRWIASPGEHVLRISDRPDSRTGASHWSFDNRTYNFDSAAGINYTVDVTKPAGHRVTVSSMADGKSFDPDAWYNVAMTSYRANGGGEILLKGAGISSEMLQERTVARYPEIRELIYKYISGQDTVTPAMVGDRSLIGSWKFVPEKLVGPIMEKDMGLVF